MEPEVFKAKVAAVLLIHDEALDLIKDDSDPQRFKTVVLKVALDQIIKVLINPDFNGDNYKNMPEVETTNRPRTFGERAVGLTFNPGNNPEVDKVKKLYADVIDQLNDARSEVQKAEDDGSKGEKMRLYSVAITEAQAAQMWAVKAITWR